MAFDAEFKAAVAAAVPELGKQKRIVESFHTHEEAEAIPPTPPPKENTIPCAIPRKARRATIETPRKRKQWPVGRLHVDPESLGKVRRVESTALCWHWKQFV